MPELTPLDDNRQEHFLNGEDLEPITRREHFYAGRESELPAGHQEPETREEWFIQKYRGGGGDITVEKITITENGTTTAPSGKAYSPIHTNVPQPTLSTLEVSENGDYDAPNGTAYNRVEVTVPLPQNAYLKKTATTSMSDAEQLPVASAVVSVTDKDKAELFLTSDGVVSEDNSPYLYRQSPSGKSCVDLSVVGGTIAWNQLVQNGNFESGDGWTAQGCSITLSGNNVATVNFTDSGGGYQLVRRINLIEGHKFYSCIDVNVPNTTNTIFYTGGALSVAIRFNGVTGWQRKDFVFGRSVYDYLIIRNESGGAVDGVQLRNVMTIDLTQMFGSTIADYIYSLEQATAGSGIAWLKSYGFLTKDYYAYDSGSLQSVNVASRKVYDSNDTLVATYPLDSDLILRGIPKLDSNNQLYFDGDVYSADGSVKRKYGIVDLGSLTWVKGNMNTANTGRIFYSILSSSPMKQPSDNGIVSDKLVYNPFSNWSAGQWERQILNGITVTNSAALIACAPDNYSTANDFKTAMNGVYLVYELATPTSETADAYENPQLVGSTEEFIDAGTSASTPTRDVDIPAGQDSKYVNGNIYIKYLDSVTTGDIELADENAIIPLENTTYISSNGSASIDYWSKEV